MGERIIFHVDVNNAFLSWSAVYLLKNGYGKDIRKIPSIIGGDESKRHGIVLAKSPIAKKYGIKTAETLYTARSKCKNLEIFPPNHSWYYEESRKFHNYLKKFSPNVYKYSIDEAFIDLTGTKYLYDDYIKLAYKIKDSIKEKFGFTVNVGVANNMLCAKMASDFEKPDKVHTLFMDEIKEKMWPLPIEDLFMVGKATSKILREIGINTIKDLALADVTLLKKYFKNQAILLKETANGIDNIKIESRKLKDSSISVSETLPKDVIDKDELEEILFRQVSDVARQLRMKNKYCSIIAVFYKNNEFINYSKQIKIEIPTDNTNDIYKIIKHLLDISWKNDPIRLIGVRLSGLQDDRKKQISLFENVDVVENKEDNFQKIVDDINTKFGNNSLIPASMKKKS